MSEDSNTINPVTVVIHPTSKQAIYSRDDFTRDLEKVSKKAAPSPQSPPKK